MIAGPCTSVDAVDVNLTLTTADAVAAEFRKLVVFGGILIVGLIVVAGIGSRDSRLAIGIKGRVLIGLLGAIVGTWFAYESTYGRFVSIDADTTHVRLAFVGPFAKQVDLPRADVVAVRFGFPDSRSSRCDLGVEAKGSTTYRSAWIAGPTDTCKGMRDDILRALGR